MRTPIALASAFLSLSFLSGCVGGVMESAAAPPTQDAPPASAGPGTPTLDEVPVPAAPDDGNPTPDGGPTGGNPSPDGGAPPIASGDRFPHLGNLSIGGTQSYDAAYQKRAAKMHINIVGGNWEGWEKQFGYSKQTVVQSIKSQSTIGSRVYQYVNLNEQPMSGSWFPTYLAKVQAMNWWVYVVGTSGTKAASAYNAAWGVVNMTAAAPLDGATGLGPYGWAAKFVNDLFHLGAYTGTSAAPALDGVFLDNVFTAPRQSGDWSRSGTTQPASNAAVDLAVRTGEKSFFDEITKLWPGTVAFGNAAYGDPGTDVTPLGGVLHGALDEGAIGYSWSAETWGGAARMQGIYKHTWDELGGVKYLLFGHSNVQANGSDPTTFDSAGNATAFTVAWRGMRHGITACLMGDGYYTATPDAGYESQSTLWFDEFDGAGLGVGYLGQAKDGFQTAAWKQGVWKREFDHGVVLWNPKGNGSQTVSLAGLGNLKRLAGTQDPTVNSGATVTNGSVTLADRDGIILLRY